MMRVKEVKPINFLLSRKETTMDGLQAMIPLSQELYREAVRLRLSITGPIHWHYFGLTDRKKPFTLEVALPVADVLKEYDGPFHFKRTELFKAVSFIHEDDFSRLPESYEQVFAFIREKKLKSLSVVRELYINVDFLYPEANVAEIQVGSE